MKILRRRWMHIAQCDRERDINVAYILIENTVLLINKHSIIRKWLFNAYARNNERVGNIIEKLITFEISDKNSTAETQWTRFIHQYFYILSRLRKILFIFLISLVTSPLKKNIEISIFQVFFFLTHSVYVSLLKPTRKMIERKNRLSLFFHVYAYVRLKSVFIWVLSVMDYRYAHLIFFFHL